MPSNGTYRSGFNKSNGIDSHREYIMPKVNATTTLEFCCTLCKRHVQKLVISVQTHFSNHIKRGQVTRDEVHAFMATIFPLRQQVINSRKDVLMTRAEIIGKLQGKR